MFWPSISIVDFLKIRKRALHAYSVGLLQGKAYRTLEKHLQQTLSWYDVSIIEWKFVGQLKDNPILTQKELSEKLDISEVRVVEIGKKLQNSGLIHKGKSGYVISEKGDELMDIIEVSVKDNLKLLLTGVSRHDLMIYLKVLIHIVDNG